MTAFAEPFRVADIVVTALEAFLDVASTLEDAEVHTLDSAEIWFALCGAHALLERLRPFINEDVLVPYRSRVLYLAEVFAAVHEPFDREVEVVNPGEPVADLTDIIRQAWEEPIEEPSQTTLAIRAVTRPGLGLPSRGSGPLFPR